MPEDERAQRGGHQRVGEQVAVPLLLGVVDLVRMEDGAVLHQVQAEQQQETENAGEQRQEVGDGEANEGHPVVAVAEECGGRRYVMGPRALRGCCVCL